MTHVPSSPFPAADSRFEALAESAADAIFTIDGNSTILFANAASERVFGYRPDELVGKRLTDLVPERLRAAHTAGLARYLKSGRRNIPWTGVELPGLRRDGSEVPLEISFGEFVDEDGQRVFSGFMRDVSERARQKRELEEARMVAESALRELASVARVMDLALASGTYEGMLGELMLGLRQELGVDEATVLLLDESTQELVVQMADGIDLDRSIRIPVGQGLAGRVAQAGHPIVIEDVATADIVHPQLRKEMASLVAVPLRADGSLVGAVHVGTRERRTFSAGEIRLLELVADRMGGVLARTRLYHAEQAARRDAEEARAALLEKERELIRVNEELDRRRVEAEAAVVSRDEVLSVVSHDLRNPVSTVMMSAGLLADPQFHLSDDQRKKQVDVIRRSAQRMNRMIQDLLDVARIKGGRLTVSRRCEEASLLATEAYDSFRPIAAEKNQTLECEIASDLPRVNVDRDRIFQVLSNYLNNAVKFSPTGSPIILRAVRTADGGVRFAVQDRGPGIRPADLANVFTRFWQAKGTAHMGSGLGLAIAKGIVEAHSGRVGAESMPGGGSTFWLELPHSVECA